MNTNVDQTKERLQNIGLDDKTIQNTLKGKQTLISLISTLDSVNVNQCSKKVGNLLYAISQKLVASIENKRQLLATYVVSEKIATMQQLDAALEYLEKHHLVELNTVEFEKAAGVGIVVTPEQIKAHIAEVINAHADELKKVRYTYNFTEYMKKVKAVLPFADGGTITKVLKESIEAFLGPKTEQDNVVPPKAEKKVEKALQEAEEPKIKITDLVGRDMGSLVNTAELLQWRKNNFEHEILTRFPPEPNGYLHIGHAKSIRFNFTLASSYGGQTYLRMDDTNPEKECQEYIDNIKENLRWLGYAPFKTTHASDNFTILYENAEKLIKMGKAYCCFIKKEEASELKKAMKPSPYRDTPVEENLDIFRKMRMGYYKENQVCLRAKIDYKNPNPTLRDPAIYRVRFTPHPHAGSKWCIYPLYDYTHCMCDSLEGISHSCCTLEFEVRRDLYYWFLQTLDLYRPYVWEFSRLNISNTVLSKRKLHQLVFENIVDGWDDPRILTLNGLRRRGYTADSINNFCDIIGVTRRGNENVIGMHVLEHCIREDLDKKANRTMAILEPIKAVIVNVADDFKEVVEVANIPRQPEKGNRKILLTKNIYLDRNDVRVEDHPDFWGVAPGKVVGLKQCGPFKVISVKENLVELERLPVNSEKPKGFLHWLAIEEAHPCVVRLYDYLFTEYNPNDLDDFVKGISKDSLKVHANSLMHKDLLTSVPESKYQFERLGYFNLDKDSKDGKFIWNRTVTLQEREKIKAMHTIDGKQVDKKDKPKAKK